MVEWFVLWLDNRNFIIHCEKGLLSSIHPDNSMMQNSISHMGPKNLQVNYAEQMKYTLLSVLYFVFIALWGGWKLNRNNCLENLLLSITICNSCFYYFHMIWWWIPALFITFIHYFSTQERVTSNSGRIRLNHLRPNSSWSVCWTVYFVVMPIK